MKGKLIHYENVFDVEFDSMPKYKIEPDEIVNENGETFLTINKSKSGWLPFTFKFNDDISYPHLTSGEVLFLIADNMLIKFSNSTLTSNIKFGSMNEGEITFTIDIGNCNLC